MRSGEVLSCGFAGFFGAVFFFVVVLRAVGIVVLIEICGTAGTLQVLRFAQDDNHP
jgi:hypothetical protein